MKRIMLYLVAGFVAILIGLIIYISTSWNKGFDVPYPEITSSNDSALITRGKYLVYGPAHCATCHVPMDKIMDVENGMEMPLIGGWEIEIPPGSFRAPNLTPDKETGIGNMSDGQIARALRYSISHDDKYLMPFMAFQGLSDEDLTAIISFLRSQPPIRNKIERSEYSFLGKALLAFKAIKPVAPHKTPPHYIVPDSTIEYGSYLANNVGNCMACHTERDMKSGSLVGPTFAGGAYFPPEPFSEGYSFVSPNLTPDPETGIISNWDQQTFVGRFQNGRVYKGSPMPWGSYSRMNETEIIALYKYLHSLEPVNRKVDKITFAPGEDIPY